MNDSKRALHESVTPIGSTRPSGHVKAESDAPDTMYMNRRPATGVYQGHVLILEAALFVSSSLSCCPEHFVADDPPNGYVVFVTIVFLQTVQISNGVWNVWEEE